MKYSAVIPTLDRASGVSDAIRMLLEQTSLPEEIVVVDASDRPFDPQPLEETAQRAGVRIRVVASPASTPHQRNVGADWVESPVVLFLDDDVALPSSYAEVIIARWMENGWDTYVGASGVDWQRCLRWRRQAISGGLAHPIGR